MAYASQDWQVVPHWINDAVTGLTAANVLAFKSNTATDAEDIADAIALAAGPAMFECSPNNVHTDKWTLSRLDGTGGPVEVSSATFTGGGDTGQVSPQVSAIVKLLTASGGRSGRGRIFLPMVAEAKQENGTLNGTCHDNMQDAWDDFLTAIAVADIQLCVNSRKNSVLHPVTTVRVEEVLATQRRRQSRLRG